GTLYIVQYINFLVREKQITEKSLHWKIKLEFNLLILQERPAEPCKHRRPVDRREHLLFSAAVSPETFHASHSGQTDPVGIRYSFRVIFTIVRIHFIKSCGRANFVRDEKSIAGTMLLTDTLFV